MRLGLDFSDPLRFPLAHRLRCRVSRAKPSAGRSDWFGRVGLARFVNTSQCGMTHRVGVLTARRCRVPERANLKFIAWLSGGTLDCKVCQHQQSLWRGNLSQGKW